MRNFTPKLLTYLGTLPFLFSAIYSASEQYIQFANTLVDSYSILIIAFISGMHWALYMASNQNDIKPNLFVISNVLALIAWFVVIMGDLITPLKAMIFISLFLILLLIDNRLHKATIIETWFFKLRIIATLIVIMSLAIFQYNILTYKILI
jgi:hypothetical protein